MKHTWNKTTSSMSACAGAFASDSASIQLASAARGESGPYPVGANETEYIQGEASALAGDSCSEGSQKVGPRKPSQAKPTFLASSHRPFCA